MEIFLMFICYVLGAVVGYEVVKFLRVAWFVHGLDKAKKALDEANATLANQDDELIEGTFGKAFDDLGKAMYTFGASIKKTSEDKEKD